SLGLTTEDLTRRAIERQPVAFLQYDLLALHVDSQLLLMFTDLDRTRAGHARDTHAPRDYGGVAGHTAAGRANDLRDLHAVNIIRLRLGADQNHRSALVLRYGMVGGENDHADGRAGRRGKSSRDLLQALLRGRIEHRMKQLIELLGIHALHSLF